MLNIFKKRKTSYDKFAEILIEIKEDINTIKKNSDNMQKNIYEIKNNVDTLQDRMAYVTAMQSEMLDILESLQNKSNNKGSEKVEYLRSVKERAE